MPILALQALSGGISITNTRSVRYTPPVSPTRSHPSPEYDRSLKQSHYWIVAAGVVVVYDWVLTIGQEIDLIWRQHWSLMKAMYLVIRYIGIPYSVANVLANMPLFSLTDAVSVPQPSQSYPMNTSIFRGNIMNWAINGTNVVVTAMLGVIMIARLHAMYQRTRSVLIFLVIVFLAVNISCGVIAAMGLKQAAAEVLILSGTYTCNYGYEGNIQPLIITIWVLNTVWEVSALCLAVWIAVKHFRDLQRFGLSTGSTTGDCFRVLIKSHVFYFASFVGVSCLQLILVSPYFSNLNSVGAQTLWCFSNSIERADVCAGTTPYS
ncbi:hypothetical protein BD769DRAFT_1673367 [Suillus cothurnatus]|nr:hypothetical protein BD769DRAFT_1673367 [Suillus cothurnatus]